MGQGLIAGNTDYDSQSLKEIKKDILSWINYAEEVNRIFKESIISIQSNGYWESIPYDFKSLLLQSIGYFETFNNDSNIILESIDKDNISKRDVDLLKNLGIQSAKFNKDYGVIYHGESHWKNYGDSNFNIAEKLYQEGRDFMASTMDAYNASIRLEHYTNGSIKTMPKNELNITGEKVKIRDINQGDSGKSNSDNKILWFIIVPVIVTVVGGIILYILIG